LTRVKICGITNLKDAQAAVEAGCDALGFVFYKKSPRYIAPQKASEISAAVPKRVKKVGVFVNENAKVIRCIARECALDMLQFHGDESPEFCRQFRGQKVIKAFRVKKNIPFKRIMRYTTHAFLFDAFDKSAFGGTGKAFDWVVLRGIHTLKKIIFLSGGLNEKNLQEALATVRPDWVDVASSVEIRPGIKSHRKIKRFMAKVRCAHEKMPLLRRAHSG